MRCVCVGGGGGVKEDRTDEKKIIKSTDNPIPHLPQVQQVLVFLPHL